MYYKLGLRLKDHQANNCEKEIFACSFLPINRFK